MWSTSRGGWSSRCPGRRRPLGGGGERYWRPDGRRVVEIERFETADGDADWLVDAAPPLHPVIERLADGARRGRAELTTRRRPLVHGNWSPPRRTWRW